MFRIKGEDADSLGEEAVDNKLINNSINNKPEIDNLWTALRNVFDPEIPVNIVDLGLVYSLELIKLDEKNYKVEMQMTLTAPGCGMGPAIAEDAKQHLESIALIKEANVDIVWILHGIKK